METEKMAEEWEEWECWRERGVKEEEGQLSLHACRLFSIPIGL